MAERIDRDDRGNLDISVSNVALFQLEYTDGNHIAIRLHLDDAPDIVISLSSREKITVITERV